MKKFTFSKVNKKLMLVSIGIATVIILLIPRDTSYTYAVPSDKANNGLHYEYYTEAICKVTDVTDTEVFVTYKGKTYSFYYENGTDCKVGDKWKITFNSAMEIVDCQ